MSVLPYQVSTRPYGAPLWRAAWVCVLAVMAALVAVTASAADSQQKADLQKQVIARVDGEAVTAADFAPYLQAYLRSKLYHAGSPERMRNLADEAIDAFLIDRVLARQAGSRDLKVDAAEVEKRLAGIKARFDKRPEWPEISARLPKLREEIETDLRIEALKREISRGEPPSEAEIRAFYESQHGMFTRPAGYRLKLLLIAVDPGASTEVWRAAEAQAQDLARRVASGESFAALARANSKHSSAEHGGSIGLVHEGQLGEAAEMALHSAKTGELAGPVRLLEGVALFDVEEKRAAALMPFPDVKERASSLLERDRAARQWISYVQTIKGRLSIDRPAFSAFLAGAIK